MVRDAVMWLNESPDDDGAAAGVAADDGIGDAEVADAVFVCGPPGMPEAMLGMLLEAGLVRSADVVLFEKWW
jgi:NAD(P)H-flavin reductase